MLAPLELAHAIVELCDTASSAPAAAATQTSSPDGYTPAAGHFALFVLRLVIGVISVWPRARTAVHTMLASRGERVAVAAGIAALMVGSEELETSRAILDIGIATFRSIRLDKLELLHLQNAARDGGESTFALSSPASLGSIDVRSPRDSRPCVRISHSSTQTLIR
jgi:hypothetical protein